MTRLREKDVAGLGRQLAVYDRDLVTRTGCSLRQIACRAAGIREQVLEASECARLAAVTCTAGQGAIGGFASSVAEILAHVGFDAFVPEATDIAGVAEAVERGADVVLSADDHRFVALNVTASRVVDNRDATGRGFVAALETAVGGLGARKVLVVGAGRVGEGAAGALREAGAHIGVVDREPEKSRVLADAVGGVVETDLRSALRRYELVVEATPAGGIVHEEHVRAGTWVAAAGVPLGVTPEARARLGQKLIHDPLQIGVATMAVMAIAPLSAKNDLGGGRGQARSNKG